MLSSANLEIELEGNLATQATAYKLYRKGLITQPYGAQLLRMILKKVLLTVLNFAVYGLGSSGSNFSGRG